MLVTEAVGVYTWAVGSSCWCYIVTGANLRNTQSGGGRADIKGWCQVWVHWLLQGLWLSVCSPVAVESCHGCAQDREFGDSSEAGGVQVQS